ncbi:MAG: glutamyl-tRNA reductase [Gammaproteobacteria bacterium]
MPLLAIGLNHKTAPVDIREQVAFGPEHIADALRQLRDAPGVEETAILSTCNRTELYVHSASDNPAAVIDWISRFHHLPREKVAPYLYIHDNETMVRHMLSVASGLDSMVLGEPQILGQIKDAYRKAQENGVLGALLEKLFQHTFSVAKQVRTDTAIGSSPVSMAFAAVSLSKQIFGELTDQTALLVGAGETIELAARHLHESGLERMIVANRSVDRARDLAAQFQGYAIGLGEIDAHLAEADIVIASTASPDPLITKAMAKQAIKRRKHAPIFMVDLAVPRDIESDCSDLQDIYLYTVDDLEQVVQEGMKSRQEAAEEAREIVETQAAHYMGWMRSLEAVDTIRDFRERSHAARDEVLDKAQRLLRNGKSAEEALEFLANTLTNKLTHAPCIQLRKAMEQGQADYVDLARDLLDLGEGAVQKPDRDGA